MATLEELVINLVAETSGLRSELDKAVKATSKGTETMEKALASFTDNSSKKLTFFETAMATMTGFLGSQLVLGAFNKLTEGVGFLTDQLLAGVESARAEEIALQGLANSLALSGQYSQDAIKDLAEYAGAMENLTGVGDDVIASNLKLLSSLTQLDAEGLKRAQTAALNLSAAIGVDLGTATQLISKGIEGNVSAFKRYGIAIEEGGTKAQTMEKLLGTLESRFGGAAEGSMKTFDGAILKIKNNYGNLIEVFGAAIVQNPVLAAGLTAIADEIFKVQDGLGETEPLVKIVGNTFVFLTDSLGIAVGMLDALVRGVQVVIGVFQALALVVEALTLPLMMLFQGPSAAIETFKADLESTAKNLNAFGEEGDGALASIGQSLANVSVAAESGFSAITDGSYKATEATVATGKAVTELSKIEQERLDKLKEWAIALGEQSSDLEAQYAYQTEMLQEKFAQDLMTEEEFLLAKAELQDAYGAEEQKKLEDAKAKGLLTEEQYRNATLALASKQRMTDMKQMTEKQMFDKKVDAARLEATSQVLGAIAQLSQSGNKKVAAIGKAAAITQATVDGYVAVQKALASAPPPFNVAIAAAVGATAAMNVAKISGVALNQGGTVPGSGPNRDTMPAMLTSGEEVVDRSTAKMLRAFLENGGGAMQIELSFKDGMIEFIETKILERQALGTSLLQRNS